MNPNEIDFGKVIEKVMEAKSFVTEENRTAIKLKGEADFVTKVDYGVSNFLQKELSKMYPEIGFMSEEETLENLSSKRWILDPIDGTTNLVFDYKMSSISLALFWENRIIFGIVYNPFSAEVFTAQKGKGAFLNNNPIHIIDREIKDSLIEFGAGSTCKEETDLAFENAKLIFRSCLDLRRVCSSALVIAYIAAGRLNGYFEKRLKPWDYAAASLILTEAGGKLCAWNKKQLQFDKPAGLIAGSPRAFEFLKKTIME